MELDTREPADPLEAGALTFAGIAYPFTPLPKERIKHHFEAWHQSDLLDRVDIAGAVLDEALGPEASAVVRRRAEDEDDPMNFEMLILGAGQAIGASARAIALAGQGGGQR